MLEENRVIIRPRNRNSMDRGRSARNDRWWLVIIDYHLNNYDEHNFLYNSYNFPYNSYNFLSAICDYCGGKHDFVLDLECLWTFSRNCKLTYMMISTLIIIILIIKKNPLISLIAFTSSLYSICLYIQDSILIFGFLLILLFARKNALNIR